MENIIKDYVLYDRENNSLVKFDSGDIIFYGVESEAIEDKEILCNKWEVIQFQNLPKDKQKEIINQLKNKWDYNYKSQHGSKLEKYCFNLALDIIGSDLGMVNKVAYILYREFEDNNIKLNK